jgi:hypothetical protein
LRALGLAHNLDLEENLLVMQARYDIRLLAVLQLWMKSYFVPGVTPHLFQKDIKQFRVLVPPIVEQQRMVAKLDLVLNKIDACQKRLVRIPILLKRLRQSILASACSGRLTADWRVENPIDATHGFPETDSGEIPAGWEPLCVGNVIESLKYGTAQKCGYEKRGVPVLRIPNVSNGTIDHTDIKYAELPPKEFQQLRLQAGDILVIRSNGSVSLVGKCALVRQEESGFAYAGYLIRIRPMRKRVMPEFMSLMLGSYDIRLQIELEARSTSGVNNINTEEIRALKFSLPPIAEQQEIIRRVQTLFALSDRISSEQIVRSIDAVARVFDESWVKSTDAHPASYHLFSQGLDPLQFLVSLGHNLLAVGDCPGFREVLEDLRDPPNYESAFLELSLAALLRGGTTDSLQRNFLQCGSFEIVEEVLLTEEPIIGPNNQ